MGDLYLALIHGPVKNKRGDLVTTAITGLNIHDIARAAATYGAAGYFLVTPVAAQQALARRITGHWEGGFGAAYNPNRQEALAGVRVVDTLEAAEKAIVEATGRPPLRVATSAQLAGHPPRVAYAELGARITSGTEPVLLLFGTGWGLPEPVLDGADLMLPPLCGPGDYNHLSVRSAVSIVLDRLCGR